MQKHLEIHFAEFQRQIDRKVTGLQQEIQWQITGTKVTEKHRKAIIWNASFLQQSTVTLSAATVASLTVN